MLSRYSWATPGLVIVVSQGRNTTALEHPWSTMVKIVFFPLWVGSPVIRSIATRWNGRALSLVGMWYRGIFCLCVRFLACWQVVHPFMYSAIHWFIPSHCACCHAFRIVSSLSECPAVWWSWARVIMDRFACLSSPTFATALTNLLGGRTVTPWLSSFPWSMPGSLDKASGDTFTFPEICWIS